MESKSPLSLQPPPLDRLLPLQSALEFYCLHEEQSLCAKWPRNPLVSQTAVGELDADLAKAWTIAGEGHLGRNSHLALLSTLWEKLLRATGCPSTRPALWSYYSQWDTFAF